MQINAAVKYNFFNSAVMNLNGFWEALSEGRSVRVMLLSATLK